MRFPSPRVAATALSLVTFAAAIPASARIQFSRSQFEFNARQGGPGPQLITLGDVNNDGLLDLLALNDDDEVVVYLNNGSGGFAEEDAIPTGPGPQAVDTGNFNNDGNLDIVVANGDTNTVSILLGDGSGSFEEGPTVTVNPNPVGLTVADINNDLQDDIVVINTSSIFLLKGDGEGNFTPFAPSTITATGGTLFQISTGFFDNNTDLDLAVSAQEASQVWVYLGNGDGTFQSRVRLQGVGAKPTGLTIRNFSNDGGDDILTVNAEAQGAEGDQAFLVLSTLADDPEPFESPPSAIAFEGNAMTVTGFDVDGNGKIDIAAGPDGQNDESGQIQVLCQPSDYCIQRQGTPLEANLFTQSFVSNELNVGGSVTVVAGKLNNDSLDDIVALNFDRDTVYVMLNTSIPGTPAPGSVTPGTGTATPTPTGPTPTPPATSTPVPTSTATRIPTVPLGLCQAVVPGPTGGSSSLVAAAAGDFNEDGFDDIATADAANNRVVLVMTHGANAGAATSVRSGRFVFPSESGLVAGDPNDPNDPNQPPQPTPTATRTRSAVPTNTQGIVPTATPDTSGRCSSLRPAAGASVNVAAPVDVGVGDFDRDGSEDVVVVGSAGASVLFGNGTGALAQVAPAIAVGSSPQSLAIADFNRDGRPDVIVTDSASDQVSILLGTGNRAAPFGSSRCPVNVSRRSNRIAALDLNGDGRDDFTFTSSATSDVSVFLQRTDIAFSCSNATSNFQGQSQLRQTQPPTGITAAAFELNNTLPDLGIITAANGTGQALVYYSSPGDGGSVRYGSPSLLTNPGFLSPSAVTSGDINRDGRRDLIVVDNRGSNSNGLLYVYLGGSDGKLSSPDNPANIGATLPQDVIVADVDRDNRDDIVVANAGNGSLSYFLSGSPPDTPTPAPTATRTNTRPPDTLTPTPIVSPTPTATATRSVRATATLSPLPTATQRGLIKVESCQIDPEGQPLPTFLFGIAMLLAVRRSTRRPSNS